MASKPAGEDRENAPLWAKLSLLAFSLLVWILVLGFVWGAVTGDSKDDDGFQKCMAEGHPAGSEERAILTEFCIGAP